ncbi:DUF4136 domain-containing protein [Fulvivirga sp. M361]|uniref:DUF4136 domain-containing protein n=1 Tax=Fulvivirga sp. M361 TaxID=2594266 RepID=UPI001626D14B|nr:DUF4136 domain-containing protein [Fulvivirga sp. M361]
MDILSQKQCYFDYLKSAYSMQKLVFSVFILLFIACSSVKVKVKYDPRANFTQFKTWCWLEGCELNYQGPGYLNDSAVIEMIGNAVAKEMYDKGYEQTDDQADLIVDYHIVVQEDSAKFARVHEEDLPFWDDYHREDYYYFLKGALIIDIGQRATGQMLWRSTSKRSMSLSPTITQTEINRSVRKAMRKFPKRVP